MRIAAAKKAKEMGVQPPNLASFDDTRLFLNKHAGYAIRSNKRRSAVKKYLLLVGVVAAIGFAVFFSNLSHASIQEKPIGNVYEIKEPSIMQVIMSRLHHMQDTGEMQKMQDEFKGRVLHTIENPAGVNLPRAKVDRTRYYDPSITVSKDIFLPDGNLLHSAGTKLNPLTLRGMTKRLLFIDQRDAEQVAWAYQQYKNSMWRDRVILVGGSYVELIKEWKKPVFFDQVGAGSSAVDAPELAKRETMVKRFGIQSLPAVIYQEGLYLRIDEVGI